MKVAGYSLRARQGRLSLRMLEPMEEVVYLDQVWLLAVDHPSDGFAKDMDFYAAHGYTVEPLPFHAMRGYPYQGAETFPGAESHLQYQLDVNTRQVSGRGPRSYRIEYTREPAAPTGKKLEPSNAIAK